MNALSWTLGVVTVLVAGGWIALGVFANGFRRSFGASENAAWKTIMPLAVTAALLATFVAPSQRGLMHAVAAVVVALVAACVWLFPKAPGLSASGLIYFGLWLLYYWQVAWAGK